MKTYNYPPSVPFNDKLYSLFFVKGALNVINRQFRLRGDTYSLSSSFVPHRLIFTRSPEFMKYFLQKNHKNYEKSVYQTNKLAKFLGKGLLTNSGDDWRRQRRLIQPGFSHKKIDSLKELILQEIVSYFEHVPKNQTIDFYPKFNQLAFNVVAKSLFSSDISQQDIQTISDILTKSQEFYIKETIHPVMEYWMKKTGKTNRMIQEVGNVRKIFQKLIDVRRQEQPKEDLLDMMLNVRYKDTNETMTDEQLIDELLILFIAGHETTANALSFTFYLLAKHPQTVTKLKDEIKTLGNKKYDLETLFGVSMSQNIIKESMRLYPPAWVLDRQALEDDEFNGFSWEKGTILLGIPYAMNRDENLWEQANVFKPERFFNEEVAKKVLISFGSGPRYCIGEHFAMMEMVLVLRHFFSHYDFKLEAENIHLKSMVTLRPDKIVGQLV